MRKSDVGSATWPCHRDGAVEAEPVRLGVQLGGVCAVAKDRVAGDVQSHILAGPPRRGDRIECGVDAFPWGQLGNGE